MSKFNTIAPRRRTIKTNRAGAQAYDQSDKAKLASILLTSFVQNQFYRKEKAVNPEVVALMDRVDPKFAAKASIFARNEFGMRSISHIVAAETAAGVKGETWTKHYFDKVVRRPDDATEILALYLDKYGKPVPNSLKKGLALSLRKFDAYQLAKWRGSGKNVSLVDVLNLVHAKPTADNVDAFAKLIDGDLVSTDTWEARISEAGKSKDKAGAKRDAWSDMIESGRMPYMAALKNIRNVAEQAPESLPGLLSILTNPRLVKKSLVLPFRYMTAWDAIRESVSGRQAQMITDALNEALEISFDNVPTFDGETLIAVDRSSSMLGMYHVHATKSQITRPPIDYALIFAAALLKKNAADIMLYEGNAQYLKGLNNRDSFTTLVGQIKAHCGGGSTNVGSVFDSADKVYDRVIILSDNESWKHGYNGYRYTYRYGRTNRSPQEALNAYNSRYHANPFIYAMDLAGYGDLSFPEGNSKVANIAGFSEKVFDILKLLERDRKALVKEIEAVEL